MPEYNTPGQNATAPQVQRKSISRFVLTLALLAALGLFAYKYYDSYTRRNEANVVAVIAYDSTGRKINQGAGFFIDPKTLVASRHVIIGADKAEIVTSRGKKYPITGVLAQDMLTNVVKLAADCPDGVKPLKLDRLDLLDRAKVVVVLSPLEQGDRTIRARFDYIRSFLSIGQIAHIKTEIPSTSSGSPIFSEDGRLIGQIISREVDGNYVRYVISNKRTLSLVSGPTVSFATYRSRNHVEWPDTPEWMLYKGSCFGFAGNWNLAQPYLEEAVKMKPNCYDALIRLGNCHGHLQQDDAAMNVYKTAIKLKPNDVNGYSGIAAVHHNQKQYQQEIAVRRKAILLAPKSSQERLELAYAYIKTGDYAVAVDSARSAVATAPLSSRARTTLGYCLSFEGKYAESENAYKEAARLNPYVSQPLIAIATLYFKQNKLFQAVRLLKKAISTDPDTSTAYYWLGRCYYREKKYDDALEQFATVVRINPTYSYAHAEMGITYMRLHRYKSALVELEEADRLKPNDSFTLANLGATYEALGQWAAAENHYAEAIIVEPDNAYCHRGLGFVYVEEGKYAQASQQKAILDKLNPGYASELGRELSGSGNP